MQKILKNEKGAISLFILLTALFFLIVVTSVGINLKNKETQIDKQYEKIKTSYEKEVGNEETIYNEEINNKIEFSSNYGTIEIIWLEDNTNTIVSSPNEPNMYSGFEKVAWTDDGTEFTPTQNSEWYSYNSVSGKEDNTTSHWANAKNTANGSYFVWIPRFAYRITYWDSEERNHITGYFDGRGMVDVKGNVITKAVNEEEKQITIDSGINTVTQNGKQYIVHPAFDNSVDNGGWRNKLSGFWVAKYEMSREDYDSTSNTWKPTTVSNGGGNIELNDSNIATIRMVSKPNVTSWRNISLRYCSTSSGNYDKTKGSHLIKNSEWGAVAYLTHSQYGRNGNEISINGCTGFITGAGRGIGTNTIYNSTYAVEESTGLPKAEQQYNGNIGKASSSTGNLYGIYDLSGGAMEYVACYDKLGNTSIVDGSDHNSDEFVTVYSNGTEQYSGVLIYNVGKVGDATKEVYNGETNNWFSDLSIFMNFDYPTLIRGGGYGNSKYAGVFYSNRITGGYNNRVSFRIALAQ